MQAPTNQTSDADVKQPELGRQFGWSRTPVHYPMDNAKRGNKFKCCIRLDDVTLSLSVA